MVDSRDAVQEGSFVLRWTMSFQMSSFWVRIACFGRTTFFVIICIHFLFHSHRLSDTHLTLVAHQTARSRNPQQTLCFNDNSNTMRRMNEQAHRSSESQSGNLNVGAGFHYIYNSDYNHVFIAPPLTNYLLLEVRSI